MSVAIEDPVRSLKCHGASPGSDWYSARLSLILPVCTCPGSRCRYMEVSSSHACAHPPGITEVGSSLFHYSLTSRHQLSMAQKASVCMIVVRLACSTRRCLD